jgi:hypothetical protein
MEDGHLWVCPHLSPCETQLAGGLDQIEMILFPLTCALRWVAHWQLQISAVRSCQLASPSWQSAVFQLQGAGRLGCGTAVLGAGASKSIADARFSAFGSCSEMANSYSKNIAICALASALSWMDSSETRKIRSPTRIDCTQCAISNPIVRRGKSSIVKPLISIPGPPI